MRTTSYDNLVNTMPHGLDRAIMQVLKFHVGKEQAIRKDKILEQLKTLAYQVHERQFREKVRDMRREGWLIGSLSADGYFLISNKQEYDEFRDSEFSARISDLSETRSAMDTAARQQFGDAVQVGLL